MSKPFDIVVVGGGVSGLCTALLLAKSKHADQLQIRLLDAAPRPRYDAAGDLELRVSAVSLGSCSILAEAGAWATVERHRFAVFDHMRVWDAGLEPAGPATVRFDADELAVPHLGYIVENTLLQQGLLEALDQTAVSLHFGTRLEGLEQTARCRSLLLDDGQRCSADLVIAADGGRSPVREIAGMKVTRRPYAQTAFVTHLECEFSHRNTAWQRFLSSGPLALLPLADGRVSIVWSTTPEQASLAGRCSDEELGRMLTQASDRVLGQLTAAGPRGNFPLIAQHVKDYVRDGLVLIGDAAHTVHPLAGQGANLGLADAAALVEVIEGALARGECPADARVLQRYERARRGENAAMLHCFTGLNWLFAADSVSAGELRRAGMRLFNRTGPLRRVLAGVALGASRTQ